MVNGRLTLLGTGTCELQKQRAAASVLLEFGNERVVYDFGRGICQRLLEQGLRSDDVDHVVLSHFHPDHLSDLIPFLHAARWSRRDPRTQDLNVYGPQGLKVQMMRLLSAFQGDDLAREKHFEESPQVYTERTGEAYYEINLHEVLAPSFTLHGRVFHYSHLPPVNNHGLKFSTNGATYALTGDSGFHQQQISFLKGVDLAVIDAGHLQSNEIVDLAVLTQVKIIVCSHLYRELDTIELNAEARSQGYTGELVVGEDGMAFPW